MLKNFGLYPVLLSLLITLIHPMACASDATPQGESVQIQASTLFTSEYKGKISGFSIKMIRTLDQQKNGQFVFASEASNFFASIEEASEFVLDENKIQVQQYTYKRSVAGKKNKESISFNWSKNKAEFSRDDSASNGKIHELKPGLLDPSLYQLFLQADSFSKKESLNYSFIKRKRIENYTFKRLPNEVIQLAGKTYNAQVLTREKKSSGTKVWIIPELDYQIGKIEHLSSKGSTYSLTLTKYHSNKPALQAFYKQVVETSNKIHSPKKKSAGNKSPENKPPNNTAL